MKLEMCVLVDGRCFCLAFQSAKQKGGPLGGKQKKSIFAVPDSIHGRVSETRGEGGKRWKEGGRKGRKKGKREGWRVIT